MRRDEEGFTLIELMVVVLIVGILAAIGVPKFAASKERAFLASMKADLRNLAVAQEAYLYEKGSYFSGAVPDPALNFQPSTGVTITLSGVTPSGWQALAQHSETSHVCSVFAGSAAPLGNAVNEGVPACN